MNIGDKRQAIILSVVAVAAVVFMGSRLAPKAKVGAAKSATASTNVAQIDVSGDSTFPTELLGNPFSHARLATRTTALAVEPPVASSALAPFRLTGDLPGASVDPEESAGSDRHNEQVPRQITLTSIFRVEKPMAMISLDGEPSIELEPGAAVLKDVKLVSIRERTIQLRVGSSLHTLSVGQSLELKAEGGR